MARAERPLSPHLQIYRWYLTMALSIGHRVSGVGLALGLVAADLVAARAGERARGLRHRRRRSMHSWLGVLVLFVYTFVLFYHLANGVRHLVWDTGYGFELADRRPLRASPCWRSPAR